MTKPDLSAFYALSKPRKPPCTIGMILAGEVTPQIEAEACEQLLAALATDRGIITSGAIAAWLADRGHDVSVNRVSTHRRGVCSCGKP